MVYWFCRLTVCTIYFTTTIVFLNCLYWNLTFTFIATFFSQHCTKIVSVKSFGKKKPGYLKCYFSGTVKVTFVVKRSRYTLLNTAFVQIHACFLRTSPCSSAYFVARTTHRRWASNNNCYAQDPMKICADKNSSCQHVITTRTLLDPGFGKGQKGWFVKKHTFKNSPYRRRSTEKSPGTQPGQSDPWPPLPPTHVRVRRGRHFTRLAKRF